MELFSYLKPGLKKDWLFLLAGLMWAGVGIMLARFAVRWMGGIPVSWDTLLVLIGLLLAFLIFRFGFSKFARKNINRIQAYQSKRICVFAFQAWTSYPLVAVMISLGIYLRLYAPLPKWVMVITYLGIGGGLFLASLQYFIRLIPRRLPVDPADTGKRKK
jgi:uncharacterized membrane protein